MCEVLDGHLLPRSVGSDRIQKPGVVGFVDNGPVHSCYAIEAVAVSEEAVTSAYSEKEQEQKDDPDTAVVPPFSISTPIIEHRHDARVHALVRQHAHEGACVESLSHFHFLHLFQNLVGVTSDIGYLVFGPSLVRFHVVRCLVHATPPALRHVKKRERDDVGNRREPLKGWTETEKREGGRIQRYALFGFRF